MDLRYSEIPELNLPGIEREILALWQEGRDFETSVEQREGAPAFVFYEGPPSANGMPGIHHVISRTIKDLVCRYKTMRGYQVHRKGGWDTHGLPVELGVEKELGITREDIGKKISVAEYNRHCREAVLRYKDQWDELTRKMGYWVDLNRPYITFDNSYIETLWWILKEMYKKGLLYQSVSIQPYSPAAGTGLSSHELNQPGTYKTVKDTSAVVMFRAVRNKKSEFLFRMLKAEKSGSGSTTESSGAATEAGKPGGKKEANKEDVYFLAWTTTPWTLPSNLGLAVGPGIDYVLVSSFNPYSKQPVNLVLAESLIPRYFQEAQRVEDALPEVPEGKDLPWKLIGRCKGAQLEEIRYEQLMPFPANQPERSGGHPFRVVLGDFVSTEDGTGIVHIAPAFGADDFKVGRQYDLGILTLVDRRGRFVEDLGPFSGRYVKNYTDDPAYQDVNVDICVELKKQGKAFRIEKYEHNYPHCWRTDKPVLYYPLDAWFIRTTAVRDKMIALNETIRWKPKSTGEGRFGQWLENMVDWNLSRSRFWGTPLPIWRTADGSEEKCIGSMRELNEEINKAREVLGEEANAAFATQGVTDLHRPAVDEIVLVSESGMPMHRVPDLVDVWFDSGSMPYAQWGLDYEKVDAGEEMPFRHPFGESYPADFIAEGVDQTRGWFYTLHAVSTLLFGSVAFKTCVSNGLVLDRFGNKMSKRLGNVVDPFETINTYGADVTRWYLVTNASPWDNMKFDPNGIREVQRKFFGTLYNTYQFFVLYANVDGFRFAEPYVPVAERPEIDRWILSVLNSLVEQVTRLLDDYEPTQAGRAMEDFVDEQLSNWYVRLCRRRFWKGEYGHDKVCAYQTLYECLETITRLMAPIAPFFSDYLFRRLNAVTARHRQVSVHHLDYPSVHADAIDKLLEERMQMAQDISSLVLSLRKKVQIKVRQPLRKLLIPVQNAEMEQQIRRVEDLIRAEVNVKEVLYPENDQELVKKKARPNFQVLGKRLGPRMKAVAAAITAWGQEEIRQLEKDGSISLEIDGEPVILQTTDVEITGEDIPGWMVAGKDGLTVALDVELSPELVSEGNARELVNRVQKIRKDQGFELTDRIRVRVSDQAELRDAVARYNDYICAEILADQLELVPGLTEGTVVEVNDIPVHVLVTKNA